MNGYEQQMMVMMQRLFQGDTGWAEAVYLFGMFGILIWKREAVLNWGMFRMSYLLYGASLVLPPIVGPLVQLLIRGGNNTNGDSQILTMILVTGTGPFLFAAAVACGLGSMVPRRTYVAPIVEPTKHPLD